MLSFYERYIAACQKKGVSPSTAAESMGFTRSAVSNWKKGKEPKFSTIKQIAEYFDISPDYFYDNEKAESPAAKEEPHVPLTSAAMGAMVLMPVIGSVRAGLGMLAEETYTGEYQPVDISLLHNNPQDYRILEVHGTSMYPFLLEGDRLVVRLQPVVESGEMCIAILGESGDGVVKKFHVNEDGSAELISLNHNYGPIPFTAMDRIYGKVVSLHRNM